jgi:hypothetical protein
MLQAVRLFGRICGAQHSLSSVDRVGYPDMDVDGVKEHLWRLMESMDLKLKNTTGFDPLNFLVNNSQWAA